MSKGTRSVLPGKSLPAVVLVLVLSGLLLTVSACENLTAGTAPTIGMVAEVVTTTTTTTPITIPATIPETTAAEEPTSTSHSTVYAAPTTTTSSPIAMGTPMTMLHTGPLWTRYEDSDPHLHWDGSWWLAEYEEASGGWYKHTDDETATVQLVFEGTQIRYIGLRSTTEGTAQVSLDGVMYFVDLCGPLASQQVLWTSPYLPPGSGPLAYGRHILMIGYKGLRSSSCGNPGGAITFDAVDVIGTLVDW
jgi:hypothetical protein